MVKQIISSIRKDKFWLVLHTTPVFQRLSQWVLQCLFPSPPPLLEALRAAPFGPCGLPLGHYFVMMPLLCVMLAEFAWRLIGYIHSCSKCNGEQQSSPCFSITKGSSPFSQLPILTERVGTSSRSFCAIRLVDICKSGYGLPRKSNASK